MEIEQIVLLKDIWQPIGAAPKLASHNQETPLHLGFSCYVFNDSGEVLMTRRALEKKVWPGIWINSCCGHPAPDEPMNAAVERRLQYELGLKINNLQLALPKFRYHCEFYRILENECCPVFVARTHSQPKLNPTEVMDNV